MPAVTTVFVHPPIPVRQYDWCAYDSNDPEDSIYGWGVTEQEAIDDFWNQQDDEPAEYDESMDGDHESALASAGWGTDEDYGYFGGSDE